MASLQDIAQGKNKLKHVRTTCTTVDGKQVRVLCIVDMSEFDIQFFIIF